MKRINIRRLFWVFSILALLMTSCLVADRPMTGVVVNNISGDQIQLIVKYKIGEQQFVIKDQTEMLIISDFGKGGSRAPQLREDLVLIEITDRQGRKKTYSRSQLSKAAQWDKKSRQWLLTVP
ncbi:MAG: hypothetical protein U9N60_04725 [Thermodesulfobacteriota bacterium]|nr:hypothetical protein [Thermodesulfobacteriota bacterium]